MKRIVIAFALALLVATAGFGQEPSPPDIDDHASALVIAFDSSVRLLHDYPHPDLLAEALRQIVCPVIDEASLGEGTIYLQVREMKIGDAKALDDISAYEQYAEFVNTEVEAFKKLHSEISTEAVDRLKALLWDEWWLDGRDDSSDPFQATVVYGKNFCDDWPVKADRGYLWRLLHGTINLVGGVALAVVDASSAVPTAGASAASISLGSVIASHGLSILPLWRD